MLHIISLTLPAQGSWPYCPHFISEETESLRGRVPHASTASKELRWDHTPDSSSSGPLSWRHTSDGHDSTKLSKCSCSQKAQRIKFFELNLCNYIMDSCMIFKCPVSVVTDTQLVCTEIIYRREVISITAKLCVQIWYNAVSMILRCRNSNTRVIM